MIGVDLAWLAGSPSSPGGENHLSPDPLLGIPEKEANEYKTAEEKHRVQEEEKSKLETQVDELRRKLDEVRIAEEEKHDEKKAELLENYEERIVMANSIVDTGQRKTKQPSAKQLSRHKMRLQQEEMLENHNRRADPESSRRLGIEMSEKKGKAAMKEQREMDEWIMHQCMDMGLLSYRSWEVP